MNRTAYCREHDRLEGFLVLAEVKIDKDSRDQLMRERAMNVSVELDCGHIERLVIPFEAA